MILKVCGMREPENIRALEALMQEISSEGDARKEVCHCLMGFIFFGKSPRYVHEKPSYLPVSIPRVGVFVNEEADVTRRYIREYNLAYVQLHGTENPALCRELQEDVKVIKAFSPTGPKDLEAVGEYEGCCDLFLFDTPTAGYGGSGRAFDWALLQTYKGDTPFLLSGGLSLETFPTLSQFTHPALAGYDLNSCFETNPGVKDVELLEKFFAACCGRTHRPAPTPTNQNQ